ncbi:UNVERIFIED_CONTAM: type 1 fimbrial protein [Aeromonas hydrophila]
MKLNIMSPIVTSIMTLLMLSPQIVLAETVTAEDSVNISVTGFVEAETCKMIESEMPELHVNMGTIPLKELQEMRDGNKNYGRFKVGKNISFKCDGSAKKINFTMKSNASLCNILTSGLSNTQYVCNEAVNGATVGLAYGMGWVDDTGAEKSEVIFGTYDMNSVQSGKIDDGKFDLNLDTIFYAPYKSHRAVSPGEIKGHLLVTVWNA